MGEVPWIVSSGRAQWQRNGDGQIRVQAYQIREGVEYEVYDGPVDGLEAALEDTMENYRD